MGKHHPYICLGHTDQMLWTDSTFRSLGYLEEKPLPGKVGDKGDSDVVFLSYPLVILGVDDDRKRRSDSLRTQGDHGGGG